MADGDAPRERFEDFLTRILASTGGDRGRAFDALSDRLRDVQRDNAELREQRRKWKAKETQLVADAEALRKKQIPDGHVAVKQEEWEGAKKVADAVQQLGVPADQLVEQFSRGRKALVDVTASDAGKAAKLSEAGIKALRFLTADKKLTLAVKSVKVGDKEEEQAFVVHEGKEVPLKTHIESAYPDLAPLIFVGGGAASADRADTQRRMPATGSVASSPSRAPSAGGGKLGVAAGLLKKYEPPANAPGASGATA